MAAKRDRFQNMGITLAQEELNAAGWKIEIILEDSQTQGAKVISAFNKLHDFDKVDAVLADDFGFAVAPVLPQVAGRKRLFVTTSLPHDVYCKSGSEFFYSATSQFVYTKTAFDRFFELHPEVKKIGLVAFDDPEWGNTYLGIWKELAAKRNIEVVDIFLSSEGMPDFKSFVAKLMAKKPDAVFFAHEPESFIKTLRQFKFEGLVVSANNVLEMLADTSSRAELEGVYLVDPKISEDFHSRFLKRFKVPPILEAYAGYEAMRTIAKAFDSDPKQPHLGMKKVKYEGVAGPIDYSGSSCAGNHSNWGLYRFVDGVQVVQ